MFRLFAAICGSLLLSHGPASADCRLTGSYFFPLNNDTMQASVVTDGPCSHGFEVGGQIITTSVDVVAKPLRGRMTRLGEFRLAYLPPKGYRGPDAYSIRVCAAGLGRHGCSRIDYNVTVR